jgi:hypothetical protein
VTIVTTDGEIFATSAGMPGRAAGRSALAVAVAGARFVDFDHPATTITARTVPAIAIQTTRDLISTSSRHLDRIVSFPERDPRKGSTWTIALRSQGVFRASPSAPAPAGVQPNFMLASMLRGLAGVDT